MTLAYKHPLFLWTVRTSGGCCSHAVVYLEIHSRIEAEHSLTILFALITSHIALYLVRKDYQQRATAPTADNETLWPWANSRWWHQVCEENLFEWWNPMLLHSLLYAARVLILLTFSVLPFFYENPVYMCVCVCVSVCEWYAKKYSGVVYFDSNTDPH
jgi:hypothetical protein